MVDSFPKWIQVFPYPTQTSGATALRETAVCSTRMAGTTIYDNKSIFISFDMRKFVVKILSVQYSWTGCKDSTDLQVQTCQVLCPSIADIFLRNVAKSE